MTNLRQNMKWFCASNMEKLFKIVKSGKKMEDMENELTKKTQSEIIMAQNTSDGFLANVV
ncbi:hypothetical protein [Faecalicatena contorta]|uniref:hypothetical protein n=1 Tax=Faecalicatena contorta TaxID=39482 RepID=UPI001897117F|nr:hypothetical protein [Faecalicatena contorta]